MNIERFKYFLDLSNTLSFTETAEMNFTTQSNISKQISYLEKDLDTTLFIREYRKITITSAGKALIPYAQKIISDYSSLQEAMSPFQNSKASTIKMCCIPVMRNYNVTCLISSFYHKHSDIILDVTEVESINLFRELDDGNCDIAFVRIFDTNLKKYEKITFKLDKFAVVLPKTHPLASKSIIPLAALKDELFFQLDKNTQLLNLFYLACQKAGFNPKVSYTGTRIDTILDFVSNNMGLTLMMENSINSLNYPEIAIRPIDITIESEVAFIRCRSNKHSFASNAFWGFLSQAVEITNS